MISLGDFYPPRPWIATSAFGFGGYPRPRWIKIPSEIPPGIPYYIIQVLCIEYSICDSILSRICLHKKKMTSLNEVIFMDDPKHESKHQLNKLLYLSDDKFKF